MDTDFICEGKSLALHNSHIFLHFTVITTLKATIYSLIFAISSGLFDDLLLVLGRMSGWLAGS
jgi:hypothetical protein